MEIERCKYCNSRIFENEVGYYDGLCKDCYDGDIIANVDRDW